MRINITYYMENGMEISDSIRVKKEASDEENAKILESCKDIIRDAIKNKTGCVVLGSVYVDVSKLEACKLGIEND